MRPAKWIGWTVVGLIIWGVVYSQLVPFSDWVVALTPVDAKSPLGEAVSFFAYDTPKVLMLLTLVVFGMGVVRSFFSPEKTRAVLAGKREGVGNVLAASLGVVTPFCSCSAVPMFIGFVSAGVPLGVTFSFLISAPMVNEVALESVRAGRLESSADLSRLRPCRRHRLRLGHRPATSRTLAGGLGPQYPIRCGRSSAGRSHSRRSHQSGIEAVKEIVGNVWPWIIAGIAAGAFIHGYVPADLLASIMGRDAWWSVAIRN